MNELAQMIYDDVGPVCDRVDFSELDSAKTVLVTGASGLIGHYVLACLKRLKEEHGYGFGVVAVMHSEPPAYMRDFLDYDGATVLRGDLTDRSFCDRLPPSDFVIHAAGYGQPGRFMENRIKTIRLNTEVTASLLERLKPEGKFLFVSTSEVYSGSPRFPYREDDIGTTNTDHPRSCYIEGKRCGEAICNAYRAGGVDAKSARLSLAYGPGTKVGDQRVLNSFIAKGLAGAINPFDQGHARRTYCYVSDAVEIMWHVLLHGKDAIYNVGGVSKTTIRELALQVGQLTGVPVNFPEEKAEENRQNVGAPDDVCLDMSKAAAEFGKTEYIGLEDGLRRTVEWQRALYGYGQFLPSQREYESQ